MAFAAGLITSLEYERLYSHQSGWEFWFGQAIRKPVPTELHGILQILLAAFLKEAGYRASSETELRIIPEWHPRPDVAGILRGKPMEKYPTKPIDVVFEVLSDGEDRYEKCRLYSSAGIPQIFYFDPEQHIITEWTGQELRPVENVQLTNGRTIIGEVIWRQLEVDCG